MSHTSLQNLTTFSFMISSNIDDTPMKFTIHIKNVEALTCTKTNYLMWYLSRETLSLNGLVIKSDSPHVHKS